MPKINCSEWVSLKELQEKAGYYITESGDTIIISDLNNSRVNFVLVGPISGLAEEVRELDCNGIVVHYRYDTDSNYVYENMKLKYSDLVVLGVLQ